MPTASRESRFFTLIPFVLFLALLCVGFPSGLFDSYRESYGFGTSVQSLLFAVYAFTLVPALLCTPLILRKLTPTGLLLAGTVALVVADVLFLLAPGTAVLFVGRAVQGITVAFLNAAAPQILLDLQRRGFGRFDPLILAIMTSAGLGLGLFGAKLLSGVTSDADRILFAVHLVVSVGFLVVVWRNRPAPQPDGDVAESPDPVSPGSGRRQHLASRPDDHRSWNRLGGWAGATSWSLGGLFLGLGTMIGDAASPSLAAVVPFIFFVAMIVGQLATRRIVDIARALRWGLGGSAVSAAATAVSVILAGGDPGVWTAVIVLAGSVIGGFSLGVVFVMATAVYERTISPETEGPQTAVFFAKIFGGNSIPTLAVGVATTVVGLSWALAGLAVVVVVTALALGSAVRRLEAERERASRAFRG
ncbi:MAG: MFS transporter [Corynebacterium sp.]|uniref:MFS transporter n=1 Tax=Corynebacterium sp. TaxID=1720 RepID=UPI003F9CA95E